MNRNQSAVTSSRVTSKGLESRNVGSQEVESQGFALEDVQFAVTELLQEAGHGDFELALATSLGSLGMDSLKLVEIIFALEMRFAVVADEQLMAELETVGDLVAMIHHACATQESTAD